MNTVHLSCGHGVYIQAIEVSMTAKKPCKSDESFQCRLTASCYSIAGRTGCDRVQNQSCLSSGVCVCVCIVQ